MQEVIAVAYILFLRGVTVPFVADHLFGTAAVSAFTFVLLAAGGALLIVRSRRSGTQENEGGVATLFGNSGILNISTAGAQHGFELHYSSGSVDSAPAPKTGTPAEFADLTIEYSHNDRDALRIRNRPLIVKNLTPGRDAYNVRLTPMETPHDRLQFNPERIPRLPGGEQTEVIPEAGLINGGMVRATRNHLPDFVAGLYAREGVADIRALNEIYEEKALIVEIEYDSEGKRMVSRCELLYTPWHRNIRTGQHTVRPATLAIPQVGT
jgi:hypothetical protein